MKQTINMPSKSMGNDAFLAKAKYILNSLDSKPATEYIPKVPYVDGQKIPIPFLDELKERIIEYEKAILDDRLPTKVLSIIIKLKKDKLYDILKKVRLYLIAFYNDNIMALSSTGYNLSKMPEPVGKLEKPENFRLLYDNRGGVVVKFKRIKGSKINVIEYRVAGSDTWLTTTNSKSTIVFRDLEQSVLYEMRVKGVGAHPIHVYSDVLTITAP